MKLFTLFGAMLLSATLSFGQTALSTVTGTVTDATGAVLANAPVTISNSQNGLVLRGATSETGNYTISQIPIGDYDLNVTVSGFKAYNRTGFHLSAGQTMREDVTLEVGQNTESVTVTAEASLLKTETTAVSQNVTLAQLNNLPLLVVGATNSGFRDPFASAKLTPGIIYNNSALTGNNAVTTMVVNGTPANTYQTRLDGMTMNPTGPRLLGAQMQTQPSTDAIEEVAIQTSNFAAEFGAAGGAMINMQTKSGTNAYHGSIYDYGTNEALNARQPYTGNRGKVRQTDWGFTIGGPIRIPKVYDGSNKTFFFLSFEQYRQKNLPIFNSTVPVDAYRRGDFAGIIPAANQLMTVAAPGNNTARCSELGHVAATTPVNSCNFIDPLGRTIASGTVYDPNTQTTAANGRAYRNPFPNNAIPVARFDPISAKILALVPQPQGVNWDNGLYTNNFTAPIDSSRVSKIPSIKLDQNVGSKGRLSFYLQETNTRVTRTPTGADPLPDTITASVSSFSSGTTVRVNYDYTLTPRLLLHVGAGWNDSDFLLDAPVNNYDSLKELGLSGQTLAQNFPQIVTAANANTAIGGMSSLGSTFPTASFERRPSGNMSANYVTGAHTFKFGVDYRLEKFPNYVRSFTNGSYTFGTNYTENPALLGTVTNQGFDGFEFASFLLGGMSVNRQDAPIALSNSKSQTGIYGQDTWKITRKLTFDYGVRWDYGTYAREQYGRNASVGLLIPNPSAGNRLGASQFEQTCQCNFATNYKMAIGPRIGAAYQLDTKTVLRLGVGVVYNATSTASGAFSNRADSSALPGNSGQITGLLRDGMPASVRAEWPSFNPGVGQGVGSVIAMPTLLDPNAGRPARLLQWSIGMQREINRNLVVEASYVANRGSWWTASGLAPLNSLSEETLRRYGFNDFTSATEAALLTSTISGLRTDQRTTLAGRGIVLPYSGFSTAQTVRQSLRDYPQYNSSGLAGAPLGKTWYDSLQVNITQRFTHGLSLNANYNYSKNLDLMSSTDVFNRAAGKNISGNDLPHQFRVTFQYVVPSMRNAGMGFLSNRIVSYILADWGLGAFMSYQSAGVIARPSSNGTTPINQFLGRGPGSAQLKKNTDGSYMNPWSVDWVDNDGQRRTDPIDINCHCFDPTKTAVFNKDAWENIPNGQWAADQSTLRFYRGVRLPEESANFSRNFRIKEGIMLNVRAEFNNIFNRMRLPGPITAGNFATDPTRFTSGVNNGLYSGGFGTFNVLGGTNGSRTGSFVARLTF
jgi:hypothetical protein